jgi:hypothetical protein
VSIIDTIQYLSKEKAHLLDNDGVYEGGVTSKVQYLWYLEVKDLVEQHIPERYATGQSREQALWRTVIGDVGLENVRPAPKEYGDYHKVWMRILADVDNFITCCKRNELPPGYKSDEELVEAHLHHTRFNGAFAHFNRTGRLAIIKDGYIGMVPQGHRLVMMCAFCTRWALPL